MGNGSTIAFWQDRWYGESNLANYFPILSQYCTEEHITRVTRDNRLQLSFMRSFTGKQLEDLQQLYQRVQSIQLDSTIPDQIEWRWGNHGKF